MTHPFDARPVIVAIAGPNGAGRSTFYEAFVAQVGLRFINADDIARALAIDAYEAAQIAERLRHQLVAMGESFAYETVFSDPHGEKVDFLKDAVQRGYTVVLCFIGLASADDSEQRVAMRVAQVVTTSRPRRSSRDFRARSKTCAEPSTPFHSFGSTTTPT